MIFLTRKRFIKYTAELLDRKAAENAKKNAEYHAANPVPADIDSEEDAVIIHALWRAGVLTPEVAVQRTKLWNEKYPSQVLNLSYYFLGNTNSAARSAAGVALLLEVQKEARIAQARLDIARGRAILQEKA